MNKLPIALLILMLLTSCSVPLLQAPTATPTATFTPTATPVPTATQTPTPVPPSPTPAAERMTVEEGGFSLLVSRDLDTDLQKNTIGIFDKGQTLIISFTGTPYQASQYTLNEVIDQYLSELESRGGNFEPSEPTSITVDGAEGISVDLTGILFEAPIEGRAIAVSPARDFVIFGLGISNLASDEENWQKSGSLIFQELLDSIEFTETGDLACEVSTDETYGFTVENPIKVGGDAFGGPARERLYLDNLRGPNGEVISYERAGSLQSGDTILDEFKVTGPGIDATLYIDEYSFTPPQAPVGFTCAGPFSLSEP